MHILFDHERPEAFPARCWVLSLKEARAQGWDTLSNGGLLKAAEEAGFEVLLTTQCPDARRRKALARKAVQTRWAKAKKKSKKP
jgi:hypothetical protein